MITPEDKAAAEAYADLDKEIGEFQNQVRHLVIEKSGAPDNRIDGSGVDSGDWRDLTLCEICHSKLMKDQPVNPDYATPKEGE